MNNNTPSVAIVILNWNGRHFLEKFLPSVLTTTYDHYKIVVADNNSNDDSVIFLEGNFPQVQVIRLKENYGFAGGYNRALEGIDTKYCVLLNSDVEVTPDWLRPMVNLLETDTTIVACQPKIRSLTDRQLFEYAGASGGWIDSLGYPFCRGRVFDTCEKDTAQYDDAEPVFWASGAAMFIRTTAFLSCGGFDEFLFAHHEEIDLCWRWQNEGYRIFVQPSSLVFHLGGGSLAAGNKRKVYLNFRNNLIVMYKNLPPQGKRFLLLKRMVLDGIAGIRFLLRGKFSLFLAVIRAHRGFYKWAREYQPGENAKKQFRSLTGVYAGSIVKDYFISGKKSFSEIVENKK